MPEIYLIILLVLFSIASFFLGYFIRKKNGEKLIGSAEEHAVKLVEDAKKESESIQKEMIISAKEEIQRSKEELDQEIKDRRSEVTATEKRLLKREENLDKKYDSLSKKEEKLNSRLKDAEDKNLQAENLVQKQSKELERVAGLTKDEAKAELVNALESEIIQEKALKIRAMDQEIKESSEEKSKEILARVMQRIASDYVSETTVTVVDLPNDDMKGRIIGREGRNIRALESLTGVDLIIDDTPGAVVLSSFDPVRREIARLSLTKLVQDGRIHPARIEDVVEKSKQEVNKIIVEEGNRATLETNVHGINPELQKYLGRLKYRTSYGQNVLEHSIEVANLCYLIAQEIGANAKIARRGGLLHDIGKSVDRELEGTHVELGVNLAKRYKESKEVIHCIEAHHNDVEPSTVEAFIVQVADAISAARPGSRRETLESYVKRLEKLEEIASSFDGIESSFAIQAGREVRILVKPDQVSDDMMTVMAHDIAQRIEEEMQYPGQIKVNVIKEVRKSHLAK